jgi:hypothetical protein
MWKKNANLFLVIVAIFAIYAYVCSSLLFLNKLLNEEVVCHFHYHVFFVDRKEEKKTDSINS